MKIEVDEEKLRKLFFENKTIYEIAEELGIKVGVVRLRISKLNLKRPKIINHEKRSLSAKIHYEKKSKQILTSKAVREKAIQTFKRNYIYKPLSEETKKKLSVPWSEERKQKLSKTMTGKGNPFYGKTHSESSKERMSKSIKNFYEKNPSKKEILSKNLSNNYEKTRKTMVSKYGVRNALENEEIKKRWENHFEEKYGVKSYFESEEFLSKYPGRISKTNREFFKKLGEGELEKDGFDIKIQNKKIYVEINPTYTHNSTQSAIFNKAKIPLKDKNYHLQKTRKANELGYRCIHIFDWDNQDKIISLVKDKEKIYARKCEVKEISKKEANQFLEENHLQGKTNGNLINISLIYKNQIVGVMTFGKPRYNKNYDWELLRLCFKQGIEVVGGSKKMWKRRPKGSIISYCDISKFDGKIYEKLGFKLLRTNPPSFMWVNIRNLRIFTEAEIIKFGPDKLLNTNYGKGISNEKIMINEGFVKVYNCGQKVFICE